MVEDNLAMGFVAYVGEDLKEQNIKNLLDCVLQLRSKNVKAPFKSQIIKDRDVIFGQVQKYVTTIDNTFYLDALPYEYNYIVDNLLYVAKYSKGINKCIISSFDSDYYIDYDHEIIPYLILDYEDAAIKILYNKGFWGAFVGFDKETRKWLIANVGDCKLYYGFTKPNGEVIFSDYKEALEIICDDVFRFPNNSLYLDGTFYNYQNMESSVLKRNMNNIMISRKIKKN